MAHYKYTATAADGKTVKGEMDAADDNALYEALRTQGAYLTEFKEMDSSKKGKKLKTPVVAEFCRQLSTLLGAGVTIVRALSIMAGEEGLKPDIKAIYSDVLKDIRKGVAFSEALENRGRAFPLLLINMFKSAEASGSLDLTAKKMSVHYDKEHRLNGKVKSAMIYPAILSVLVVIVVIFIMTWVVPQFSSVFEGMDVPLPTRILLGSSDFIKTNYIAIFVTVFAVVFVVRILLRIPKVRYGVDMIKLKIPKVGKLLSTIYTARFARTLSSLYSSGLPIISALQIGADTIGNTYISAQFEEAIKEVRRGNPLSEAIGNIKGFKGKLAASIAIGEETGNLDDMLDSTAEAFEFESEQATQKLTAMLEPVMIVIMAVIVGFIMISVMMPLMNSYSQIEGA